MIDWLTIVVALVIIASLVGFFGFLAWKINMSDPLAIGDNKQISDVISDKKRKERNNTEQTKKKRKDPKKPKNENKNEEQQRNKSSLQTSEETDNESEQESLKQSSQTVETSSKVRKRNKNKVDTTTASAPLATNPIEINIKRDKNPIRAPPVTHPKIAPKDELEPTKQQPKLENKTPQVQKKQVFPTTSAPTTAQKTAQPAQKEQPFTVVGGNKHKTGTPPLQQQSQNKVSVNTVSAPTPVQPLPPVQVQHEKLVQRQQFPPKETPTPVNGLSTNSLTLAKKETPAKISDLIKSLPSSQVVVTELMSALDAFPLSTDELDIIMHKIANKQSVLKQDWSKLQHGQKVDPQALIGQVKDESAKAYEDDLKTNSFKHVRELREELNAEKLRYNTLLKEKVEKEREIQILNAQLGSTQQKHESTHLHPQQQQQKIQTIELQLKRITEENIHLNHQLQQQQQQQILASKLMNSGDGSNIQLQVLSDQVKKLSVDNAHLEKKAKSNELLAKEAQEQNENLTRYNQQLTQSLDKAEKELKHVEEKHHKQLNEILAAHLNEINEYKQHVERLTKDNEQLKREEIVHVEPTTVVTDIQTLTVNNEEREQFEKDINELKQKLSDEAEEYKTKIDNLQIKSQFQENELRQEIERLKQDKVHEQQQINETLSTELVAKNNEINALRAELDDIRSTILQSEEKLRQEREKQRQLLTNLLPEDIRSQLSHDNQDFEQWFSSYRQHFESVAELSKQNLQEEFAAVKLENNQLHKNMNDVESQLKEIEKTVQYKEETLLTELRSKDALLESTRNENDQLNDALQSLRSEVQRLQLAYDASVNEVSALKVQLNDRFLVTATTPPVDTDESFELVKQPLSPLAALVIDHRAEQLTELLRSGREALENQDSIAQQLDKHLNDMQRSGNGETSTSNADESTVLPSSDQQS